MGAAIDATSSDTADAPKPGHPDTAAGASAKALNELRFDLLRSALYHDMRQLWLNRVHKLCLFVTVILGSGAIAAFGAEVPIVGQAAGAGIAVVSAAQLVWDFSGSARDHLELRKRFYALLSRLEGGEDMLGIRSAMTELYAEEPPVILRVNKRAHDRAGTAIFGNDFVKANGRA